MRLKRGITVDSGVGNCVMPRRMVKDQSAIRDSPGSNAGVQYGAANRGRILNEGAFDFAFSNSEGNGAMFAFPITKVNKNTT